MSSDGDTIDFIYGVINWKEIGRHRPPPPASPARSTGAVGGRRPRSPEGPVWAGRPACRRCRRAEPVAATSSISGPPKLSAAQHQDDEDDDQPSLALDPDAGLADRLCLARETAEAVKHADARSRAALYRALGHAYDFALAAEAAPEDYAEMLDDAGLKAQARAPMTPVVKLVFGVDYDKTRLTEFAAALSWARREDGAAGRARRLSRRLRRRPQGRRRGRARARAGRRQKPDRAEARARSAAPALPVGHVEPADAGDEEFVLLVARREADGRLAVVAPVASTRRCSTAPSARRRLLGAPAAVPRGRRSALPVTSSRRI